MTQPPARWSPTDGCKDVIVTDWMTIRVVLSGQGDDPLPEAPGRVLLVHADHAFADLAEAIDTAFGRWDLTPLHEFDVEGRVVLSAEAAAEDPEAEVSDEVTVGEVGLRTGARFTYVFDLGEQWTHDCVVEAVGVDPFETSGEEPEVPVPVFGWGTIPDQYGRVREDDDEDGDDGEAWAPEDAWDPDLDEEVDDDLDEDLEDFSADETASWEVVRAALADVERAPDDPAIATALAGLRERAAAGDDTAAVLLAAAGLDATDLDAGGDAEGLWLRLAAGVVAPRQGVPLAPDLLAAWGALEPADWAGVVIETVRSGPGVTLDADEALDMIARCPEVEEDELTEEGEEVLREGLGVVTALWQALGVLDEDERLTTLGRWGLPASLQAAWEA